MLLSHFLLYYFALFLSFSLSLTLEKMWNEKKLWGAQSTENLFFWSLFVGLIAPHSNVSRKFAHSQALSTSRCAFQKGKFLRDFEIFNFFLCFFCTLNNHTPNLRTKLLENVPFNASPTQQMCVVLGLFYHSSNIERKKGEKLRKFSQYPWWDEHKRMRNTRMWTRRH